MIERERKGKERGRELGAMRSFDLYIIQDPLLPELQDTILHNHNQYSTVHYTALTQ